MNLSGLIDAAVLLPVYRNREGDMQLVLMRRAPGGAHGGELAFPGGKREAIDSSLQHTALRETEEEIGLAAQAVQVLERLPVVETRSTGFRITPFLGKIVPPDHWRIDAREVAEVIEVRLETLSRAENQGTELMRFSHWPRPVQVPFYRVGRHKLWGASFRMLHPLLPSLLSGAWEI